MGQEGIVDSAESFGRKFGISRETLERLTTYAQLLGRWQKTINLVAPSTLNDTWQRHFADSAQLWQFRPASARVWLDIGSGAGFPGLVLAILGAEAGATHHILVESDARKAAFLREVARKTGIVVDILCMRIENSETRAKVKSVDCITARALAPLPRLLEMSAPYFESKTLGLFLKGREVAAEIEQAAQSWRFDYELKPSVTDEYARVVLLKALKPKREE
ncbi:16S rRNA (guanine(527)-N(7))-methyltransferase RsmG [Hyphomicrobium sp.]|jgi:16S rRNA (guanine527-N7)-methyltransferase|uniref:16S rRNA (guanine(527)-N(7))-methyltransferase RsmG n=1 Tax=Hyphomicrobium sp. TaxID=82 RepID=UPI002C9BE12E|nr:16S rRNA (guanine(527)-N(7))-methyltransferase RsmG [Hyphomicrobium sp.]HVZ04931.1 16S rRNA (guanine(527)-N(7))-methyltransferase RsmG [Hyphomicrobium sp.]